MLISQAWIHVPLNFRFFVAIVPLVLNLHIGLCIPLSSKASTWVSRGYLGARSFWATAALVLAQHCMYSRIDSSQGKRGRGLYIVYTGIPGRPKIRESFSLEGERSHWIVSGKIINHWVRRDTTNLSPHPTEGEITPGRILLANVVGYFMICQRSIQGVCDPGQWKIFPWQPELQSKP
ncbi:hypothetical protein F5Y07DRAFT_216122 [Xylaria sp. FL0933]|nr:hypothetical protein F5Y07DRAFT_216122 [Xylaria sp. FL0933]